MSARLPIVADHAVLRWLERVAGLDVEAVRMHLAGRAMTAVELGAISTTLDGVRLVIEGGTVVTVVRTKRRRARKARRTGGGGC
ncbi:hypothetical protein [Methylobrevis pamukkalensis]|uniref:Uncharacterized protein n=1 Tax=Methylobrevis pamukkalensis TaxID=1439726 RepID=A0A1E3H4C0_9HYPH|nr:hypothetical protein [Methylobrevis pamukkalensis]ODN71197.1 hypothetical protein A6302_01486 [Methylobrevis pamukkalensis]